MSLSTVAQGINVQVWVAEETTFGTAVQPTLADQIYPISVPEVSNEREELDDEEKDGLTSTSEVLLGKYNPTEYNLEVYIKPSGSAGTAPQGALLYECAFGTETAGGDVKYSLANDLKSFTLWVLHDHTLLQVPGCTVNEMSATIGGSDYGRVTFSGMGLQRYWAGTDELDSGSSGTSLIVTDAGRYSVNSYVIVGSDDNSGSGFKITAINYTTNTLTVDATPSVLTAGTAVTPWIPDTGSVGAGYKVYGKLGYASREGVASNLPILESTVTLNNNLEYPNDEKNNSLYPSEVFRPGKREVTAEFSAYYHEKYADFFYYQNEAELMTLEIPLGSTSGKICTFNIPDSAASSGGGLYLSNPNPSGDGIMEVSVSGKAIASLADSATGNNELSVTFS